MVSETFKLRGDPALSYKKCQRLMSAVPMDAKIKLRLGDKAYVNECEPYAKRDYSALRSNEIWNGDHHRLDVIISHGGKHIRPWITAWQDVRSRLIVGWYVFAHDPNTDTILFALGDAAKAHGVPDEVYVDNGKDYDAKALQGITKAERRAKAQFTEAVRSKSGVLAGLGIGISHCQPYHGQSKPIERFFRTLKDEFSKMQRTYCGGTPAEKPDDLAAKVARGASPTLEDFTEELNCWIADYYNAGRGHAGDSMNGQTPAEVFAACLTSKRTAPEAALDEMMLKPTQLLKIGQNGISYMGMHFDAPELARHFGKWARLHLDPRDIRKPRAYDEEGRFMCIVETREKIPFKAPLADLKAIQKEKGRRRKAIAEVQESRPRIFENPATAMIRMGAQRAAALAASAPAPSIRIDGIRATEATKAVDAAERRKASASTPRKSFLYDPENAFDLPTPTRERSTRLEDYARAHFPAPGEEPALPTFRDVARHLNDEADARRAAEELEEAAERERIGDALYRSNRSA
jgi:transposase InsO family protein